jgi:hypothetical protein
LAKIIHWFGGTGQWSDPGNWNPAVVPGARDLAISQNGTIIATSTKIDSLVLLDPGQNGSVGLSLVDTTLDPRGIVAETGSGIVNITLQDSILSGAVWASNGITELSTERGSSGLNTGFIGVGGTSVGSDMFIANLGPFNNDGVMWAGNRGNLTFDYGGTTYSPDITNSGQIEAVTGGTVLFEGFGSNEPLVNAGRITAAGGEVAVISNGGTQAVAIKQLPNATINITNNGSLLLEGNVDGGTIQIESGMLGYTVAGLVPGGPGATGFGSTLAFTGTTADLRFYEVTSVQEIFDPATNILAVTDSAGKLSVNIPLANNHAYSAANFHVSGVDVIYTAQPTS